MLIHRDDFFRPLDRPLRALPYLGDDLEVTMDVFTELALADGVGLSFPRVSNRENPWAAGRHSPTGGGEVQERASVGGSPPAADEPPAPGGPARSPAGRIAPVPTFAGLRRSLSPSPGRYTARVGCSVGPQSGTRPAGTTLMLVVAGRSFPRL